MKTRQPKSPLTDPLRQAIVDSGLPLLTLAEKAGVSRPSLIHFRNGVRSLRLDMADRLAAYFGFQLVRRKAK